jgi:hypothetical protein
MMQSERPTNRKKRRVFPIGRESQMNPPVMTTFMESDHGQDFICECHCLDNMGLEYAETRSDRRAKSGGSWAG